MIKGLIFILVMAYSLPSFSWIWFNKDNKLTINPECDIVGVHLYLQKHLLQDMINNEQEYFRNINVEEFNCDEPLIVAMQRGSKIAYAWRSMFVLSKQTEVCVSLDGFRICESLKTGKRTTTKIEEVSEEEVSDTVADEEEEEDSWFNWIGW